MLLIEGPKGERLEAQCEVSAPPFSEKLFKGGKLGLIIFGATLASAFIPILHFVTVPTGLILSGFFLFKALTRSKEVKVSSFPCPVCSQATGKTITLIVSAESFYSNCPSCGVLLKMFLNKVS